MGTPSYNGSDPCVVRVRNVNREGFEYQITEWEYLSGKHKTEEIGYLVVEKGTHVIDGLRWEAGRTSLDHNWKPITLKTSYGGMQTILAQVATYNGEDPVTTRMRKVVGNTFEIKLQEEEKNGNHMTETVHYVAVEFSDGISPGYKKVYTYFVLAEVDENWKTITFPAFKNATFFGQIASYLGEDPVSLRRRNLDNDSIQVFCQEEESRDPETVHHPEDVRFLIIEK